MSDNTKMILWVIIALIAVGLIIWYLMSSARRREMEARRMQAADLRASIDERLPAVTGAQDRASVTERIANESRLEAEARAAEARAKAQEAARLEAQAAEHRVTAEQARSEQEGLLREADRIDPDVRTDETGVRVDDVGTPLSGGSVGGGSGAAGAVLGAVAGAGALGGAAAFGRDEDEPDLADAENPFAAQVQAEEPAVADVEVSEPEVSEPEVSEPDVVESAPWSAPGADADVADAEDVAVQDEVTEPEVTEPEVTEPEVTEPEVTEPEVTEPEVTEPEVTEPEVTEPEAEDIPADPTSVVDGQVHIPALDDVDDVIVGGGTPPGDPGDHRGQPWSTSFGDAPPATSGTVFDEDTDRSNLEAGDTVELADDEEDADAEVADAEVADAEVADAEVADSSAPSVEADTEAVDSSALSTDEWDDAPAVVADPGPIEHSDDAPLLDDEAGTDEEPEGESAYDAEEVEPVAEAATPEPAPVDDAQADEPQESAEESSEVPATDAADPAPWQRRISAFDEVTDGGYGIGSAAPIGDRAQPLGHAVKAWRDTNTFLSPDADGYDGGEPDVWFFNEEAARRAGFNAPGE